MLFTHKDINYVQIGKKFKYLRHKNKYTQEDVAKYLDMECASYSNMERGVEHFNLLRIIQLCDFFKVLPGDILNDCTCQFAYMKYIDNLEQEPFANNQHSGIENTLYSTIDQLMKEVFKLSERDARILVGIAQLMQNPDTLTQETKEKRS